MSNAFAKTIGVAAAIVVVLGLIPPTRKYAAWVGLLFLIVLYLRWKRTGGK